MHILNTHITQENKVCAIYNAYIGVIWTIPAFHCLGHVYEVCI